MHFFPVSSHCIIQVLLIVIMSHTIFSGTESLTCLRAITYILVLNFPDVFLPGGSGSRESSCNEGGPDSISGLGRSPVERNSYPLQYSCLENSKVRGAWQAIVHGVTESDTTQWPLLLLHCSEIFLIICCSVGQSCPTLCNPKDSSTPGLPSLSPRVCSTPCPLSWWCHQPSCPLLSPSPPSFNLSQHQGPF